MRSYVRAYTQCLVAMSTLLLALRADLTHAQTGQPQVTPEAKLHLNELINWVHSNGGYVGEGVAFGYENSIRGLVAGSKGFKMGDIIMDISNAAIMLPTQKVDNPAEYDQCAQIARVHDELNKGEESHWWEYLRIDDSLGVRTIALWDDSVLDQLQGLPPYQHRFSVDWYVYECKENANKALGKSAVEYYHDNMSTNEKQAMWMFHTRHTNSNIIPLWDLSNHHNGLCNMIHEQYEGGIRFKASMDISPGKDTPQIFFFINYCALRGTRFIRLLKPSHLPSFCTRFNTQYDPVRHSVDIC